MSAQEQKQQNQDKEVNLFIKSLDLNEVLDLDLISIYFMKCLTSMTISINKLNIWMNEGKKLMTIQ